MLLLCEQKPTPQLAPCLFNSLGMNCCVRANDGARRGFSRNARPVGVIRYVSAAQKAATSWSSKKFPWKISGAGGRIESRS